ncbi:MAG: bifunctional hydroxymethylpyrimidine kinase/phosphomethylpyrimidine kinase [Corynebacterium sp.]|nr:bifunctional hydroxymethylpyrimidine kinase/phosphomethylpyrimidine kinase [Corynebacterium sp.]
MDLSTVLTIAGSDSSGGAGIQADLKTMTLNGVYGMSAITALTAQNTTGVQAVHDVPAEFVAQQIDSVFSDIRPQAVKIGMVSQPDIIEAIVDRLVAHRASNIVVDPVMVSTAGSTLISQAAIGVLTEKLFPLATAITPNILEAQEILHTAAIDTPAKMEAAAAILGEQFGVAVLIKGGHSVADANDVLFQPAEHAEDRQLTWFHGQRIDNHNAHGTGCTLSSAIAANLAKRKALPDAIEAAKDYLTRALAAGLDLGAGDGPLDHAWELRTLGSAFAD